MKKMLSVLLLIVLLCQALPINALAAIGKVLTGEELAAAYILTGLSSVTGGVERNAVYSQGHEAQRHVERHAGVGLAG